MRLAAFVESPAFLRGEFAAYEVFVATSPCHQHRFAALGGVRLLHHLADSGQGFPADSQRGAIAQAIDAKTPRVSHAPSKNQQDGKSALSKAR